MLLSDLSQHELGLLSDFLPSVTNYWLKGRLAHVIWVASHPRDVQSALIAIDSYRQIPLTLSAWLHGGHASWAQAIMLCKVLGKAAASQLEEIERTLVDAVLSSNLAGEVPNMAIASLLRNQNLGKEHAPSIASWFTKAAREISEDADHISAAEYFKQASVWFAVAKDLASRSEMIAAEAESYVTESERRLNGDSPSALAAASWLQDAILTFRTIPGSERQRLRVDERIDELRTLLSKARREAVAEFKTFETSTDVSEAVTRVQGEMRGRELPDVLKRFAAMVAPPPFEQMRDTAKAISEETLFTKLVNVSHMSSDGRVVGHRQDSTNDSATTDATGLEDDVFGYYQQVIGFEGGCVIEAARSVICEENELTEQYFIELATVAPLMPPGRPIQFGKALHAGFVGDYITAAHLLTPQLEHLIRFELNSVRVQTTSLHPSGIEHQKTLDTLLAFPEAEAVFGKDLLEMLKALLCDPNGEGLRNQLAHGLFDDADFPLATAAYLWGLTLSLTVRSLVAEDIPIPDLREVRESPAQ